MPRSKLVTVPYPASTAPTTSTDPGTASASPISVTSDTDLAAVLSGRLVSPTDPDWDAARQAWNLAVDQRPAFVVQPATAGDVAATINFARTAGLRVAPQGTGHNAGALGDLSGTILLRTDRLREVTIDVDGRIVRAGAGVLWQEVTQALAPHGLVGLAGSSGDVGVAGYLLGGGYSWFARRFGLGCSAVTAVEVVTGDGQVRRVDADHEPDLFWAVRGGAGNVGVVTAIEFRAFPVAQVYAGMMLFPIERAREVFAAYERWTRNLDEAATTCVRLLRVPPLPDIPEFARGRAFVAVDGAIDLPGEQAEALLAPLRALGPEVDMWAVMPAAALGHIHMDPPQPSPACGDGIVLADLTPDAIDALLDIAGPDVDSPLLAVDLRHLGGAAGRPDPNGGAIDHLPGRFLLFAVGITPVPPAEAAVIAAAHSLRDALRPWAAERDYPNFRETADTASRFYAPAALERLRAVRQQYDPQRVVRSNHEI
jgi:FAD/FMN-containing dehydrogenase